MSFELFQSNFQNPQVKEINEMQALVGEPYVDFQFNSQQNSDRVLYLDPEDGKTWETVIDRSQSYKDTPNAYLVLNQPVKTQYIRYKNIKVPGNNLVVPLIIETAGISPPDRTKSPSEISSSAKHLTLSSKPSYCPQIIIN